MLYCARHDGAARHVVSRAAGPRRRLRGAVRVGLEAARTDRRLCAQSRADPARGQAREARVVLGHSVYGCFCRSLLLPHTESCKNLLVEILRLPAGIFACSFSAIGVLASRDSAMLTPVCSELHQHRQPLRAPSRALQDH
eukprot:2405089-Pleurochrysis_carterae.AAC.2